MNVSDAKKLRQLTWAHLKRPDPFSWLLAADLLEENGLDEESAKWRWRAEGLPALQQAIDATFEMYDHSILSYSNRLVSCLIGSPGEWVVVECGATYRNVFYAIYYESIVHRDRNEALHQERILLWGSTEAKTKRLLAVIDRARTLSEQKRGNQ